METITLTINDRTIQTEPGRMVLPVALENGIHIPHYCYHPALSVAGNCRMCLVEVEGVPKLQTACSTPVRDGMVVHSDTPRVREAVRHVLEFLLINHPLDCPVCDQAGECGLQEYYMQVGQYDPRFAEQKVTKHRKASPIGRWVSLDQERCILCSRCVRFTREVTGTGEMAIYNRGDHAEIDVYPGGELHSRYTGNLVDICPVGALTCRDFRFQCRVWYLHRTPSICPGCSRGCGIEIHDNPERPHHGKGRRIMRIKPRTCPGVNGHWICDDGRYGYHSLDEGRTPWATRADGQGRRQLYLRDALDRLGEWLRETPAEECVCLLSADSTNESLFAARRLIRDTLGISCILPDFGIRSGDGDGFLIREDKHPNTAGVRHIFGLTEGDILGAPELAERLGSVRLALVFRHELPDAALDALRARGGRLVFFGSNENATWQASDLALPLAAYAEQDGTFTSFQDLVQRITRAVSPLGEASPDWDLLSGLSRRLNHPQGWTSAREVFQELARDTLLFRDLQFPPTPSLEKGRHE